MFFDGALGDDPFDAVAYRNGCNAWVQQLAQLCVWDPEQTQERFHWFGQHLARVATATTPVTYEFVLQYVDGAPKGFAILSRGAPQRTLSQGLGGLLAASLHMMVDSGLPQNKSQSLADLFRISFPNPDGLTDYSATASGLMTGLVPHPGGNRFKVYFNTRLDPSGSHRDRIIAMGEVVGIQLRQIYDDLYQTIPDTRFVGMGLDFDSNEKWRPKLYLGLDVSEALTHIGGLAARWSLGDSAVMLDKVDEILATLASEALTPQAELAIALPGGPPRLKLTLFFDRSLVGRQDIEHAGVVLKSCGHDEATLRKLALESQKTIPLHGIGIELWGAPQGRVNLYLAPALR